jgi:hypothetical protein
MSSYSLCYQDYCQFFLLHKMAQMYSRAASSLCSLLVCQSVYPEATTQEHLIEFSRNFMLWSVHKGFQHLAVLINNAQHTATLYRMIEKSLCT